jgi:hypothetical protein
MTTKLFMKNLPSRSQNKLLQSDNAPVVQWIEYFRPKE